MNLDEVIAHLETTAATRSQVFGEKDSSAVLAREMAETVRGARADLSRAKAEARLASAKALAIFEKENAARVKAEDAAAKLRDTIKAMRSATRRR